MLEIIENPKSEVDLLALVGEVSTSPFIAHLTTNEITRYRRDGTIRFLYDAAQLLGFAVWQNIDADWSEIGPVYIIAEARGAGLATRFAKTLFELSAGKRLFAITRNPHVKRTLVKAGFRNINLFALPRPIIAHLLKHLTLVRIIAMFQKHGPEPIGLYITDWRYPKT